MSSKPMPPMSAPEPQRTAVLHRYRILDTPPEVAYDDATLLAVQVCCAPIALVTLVDSDREWFKSKKGIPQRELPRYASFCAQAIKDPANVMIVEDAAHDPRFESNALVKDAPHVRFYAGAPLVTSEGLALGTVCVMDPKSRRLDSQQLEGLKAIARQVMSQLELRRMVQDLETRSDTLLRTNRALEQRQSSLTVANAELHKESFTDALTGVFNRRAFAHYLASAVAGSAGRDEPLTLIMFDVDHFKQFNDEWGHPAGDEVLKQVATLLQKSARKNDVVARYGGEEFAILCPGISEDQALRLAERLCNAVSSRPWKHRLITLSAGVAAHKPGVQSGDVLVSSADQALYQAKSGGRNRVATYTQLMGASRWLTSRDAR